MIRHQPTSSMQSEISGQDSPGIDVLVRREQVALLYANIRTATYGDSVVAMVFGLLMYWDAHKPVIFAWMAAHLYTVLRLPRVTAYFRDADAHANLEHWIRIYCDEIRYNSIVWGAAPLLFLPDSLPLISLTMLILMGLSVVGVLAVSPLLRAVRSYILPMMLGLTLALLLRAELMTFFLAGCCVVFLVVVLRLARIQHKLLVTALRARFEKAALAERLEEQMQATELASQEKTRFLAAASHDLRQPLHAITLLGSALVKELDGHPKQPSAERLMLAVSTLGQSLDAMLDVSRLDAGVVQTERLPMPLQGLFQSLNHSLVSTASEKDIQLRFRATSLWVDSDPQLLRRLLSNLIDNAIKYTQHGGVLVVARRRFADRVPAEVWIEIYDSGVGIAPEHRDRVFEEFYQVGNPGRDRSLGLGIGLSIVKRLSQLLSHPVELHSTQGRGTRFRVRLPEAAPQAVTPPAATFAPPLRQPRPLDCLPRRVLVLDDEADVRDSMQQLLQAHGMVAVTAGSEEDARAALRESVAQSTPFDLLLCDFRLAKGADGLLAGQTLSREFSHLPLLLITGETSPERLQRVREAGVAVLFKPVSTERLLHVMAAAVR